MDIYCLFGDPIDNSKSPEIHNKFFESYISYGIGICIAFHVFINIGVSSGMLPTKGLTLPFISFGGTNLMLMFALIALLFRINLELNENSKIEGKVMSG